MNRMRSCPFCGSDKLKLMRNATRAGFNGLDIPVYNVGFYVRCTICNARGGRVSGKVLAYDPPAGVALPGWASREEDLEWSAVDAWNMRHDPVIQGFYDRWKSEKEESFNEW